MVIETSNDEGEDMAKLNGKVAVVTGASKGIGAAIAEKLGSEGAKVVVNFASDRAGVVLLWLLAAALVAYGGYMFAEARYRSIGPPTSSRR